MQDLINNFGINPVLLVAQIVNFLILLYLLKRFAYKPIFKMLSDRKQTIEEGLKNAEKAQKALEKAVEEEKKILRKAQDQAKQILMESRDQAEEMRAKTEESTKKQIEQMLSEARQKIDQDAKAMEKRLALSTAQLAVDMLKDAISDVFSNKEQEEVVKKLAKKFKIQ